MYRLEEFQDQYGDEGRVISNVVREVNNYLDMKNIQDFEVIDHSTIYVALGVMGAKVPMDRITIKYKVK